MIPPDSLRALLRDVYAAREYEWTERTSILAWLGELYQRLMAALLGLEHDHPVAYYVLLIAMIIVLVAILVHFGYVLWVALSPVARPAGARQVSAPLRDAEWYRAEAGRLVAQERFAEALAHRFLALLLELDGRKTLSFHASKTPAEYLDEVRFEPEDRGRFRVLVLSLYQHLFAGVPCTPDEWTSFDREAGVLGGRVATG